MALGWLLNLDFAGGATEVIVPAVGGAAATRATRKIQYGYGYRYIAPLLGVLRWSS